MAEDEALFLVCHDYGMGALWWWVRAASPQEIIDTLAEVEVISDPEIIRRVQTWELEVVSLHADLPGLTGLRTQRSDQRDQPGYGALAGLPIVHLRYEDPDAEEPSDEEWLIELGPDGRRLRQVEIQPDGSAVAETPDDWLFNPPFDLYDPRLAAMVISSDEFEAAWSKARQA